MGAKLNSATMAQTQLRIKGDKTLLRFRNKAELEGYLKRILSGVEADAQKKVDHLPLVEFYLDELSVVYKDYSDLPDSDVVVGGTVLVCIDGGATTNSEGTANS